MVNKVIVYGSQSCPWCARTRKFLDDHKIKFKDVDVGRDKKGAKEAVKKSGQIGVPVIDINGTIIVGFDESAIKKTLKIK